MFLGSEPPLRPHLDQLPENEGEIDTGIVFTAHRPNKRDNGTDRQFPILDINSSETTREERSVSDVHKRMALENAGHDNDAYVDERESGHVRLVSSDRKSPVVRRTSYVGETDDAPKTSAESTLPWRRDSVTNQPDADMSRGQEVSEYDRSSMALKQEEFPPWISNKEYIPNYASPTNTLLAEIDRKNSMQKTPSVYEIFTIADGPAGTSDKKLSRSLHVDDVQDGDANVQRSSNESGQASHRVHKINPDLSTGSKNKIKPKGDREQLETSTVTISMGGLDPSSSQSTTINLDPMDTSRL